MNDGYSVISKAVDERGQVRSVSYFGVAGERTIDTSGVHGWSAEYDKKGNESIRRYVDINGKPIANKEGHAVIRKTSDACGRVLTVRCFDAEDQPTVDADGIHGWNSQYDSRGNETLRRYLGIDGAARVNDEGVAVVLATVDALGRTLTTRYFDAEERPTANVQGSHGWNAEYDSRGNQIRRSYIGTNGGLIMIDEGYAVLRQTFDERGRLVTVRYFDARDQPTAHVEGFHGLDWKRDVRGNEIEVRGVDIHGELTMTPVGAAISRSTCDELGRITSVRHFDAAEHPTTAADGLHGWDAQYDERGNKTVQINIGTDGRPLVQDGYASVRTAWDERSREVSRRYFDANGVPINLSIGVHGWDSGYDSDGRELSRRYVNASAEVVHPIGVQIKSLVPGGNAEKSGLLVDDTILLYNETFPESDSHLIQLIARTVETSSSDSVELLVARGGRQLRIKVAIGRLGAMIATRFGEPAG
jgi:hypothetical protein